MAYSVKGKCKVVGRGKSHPYNSRSGAPQRHRGGDGSYFRRYAAGAGGNRIRRSAPRGRGTY